MKAKIKKLNNKSIIKYLIILLVSFTFIYSAFLAKKQIYEIKFVDGPDVIDVQYLKKGEELKIPNPPEKEGFIFVGWYYNNAKIEEGYIIETKMKIDAAWNFDNIKTTNNSKK